MIYWYTLNRREQNYTRAGGTPKRDPSNLVAEHHWTKHQRQEQSTRHNCRQDIFVNHSWCSTSIRPAQPQSADLADLGAANATGPNLKLQRQTKIGQSRLGNTSFVAGSCCCVGMDLANHDSQAVFWSLGAPHLEGDPDLPWSHRNLDRVHLAEGLRNPQELGYPGSELFPTS